MQVLVSLGLFFGLYLLVRRILPLGLLCDKLLCLRAVGFSFLLASPVTPLRVPPTCRLGESLSSTPVVVAVLPTLSNIGLLTGRLPKRLTKRHPVLSAALLSRRLVVESPRLLSRRSPS